MADHWKSIANLLGAPGVDAPEEAKESQADRAEAASAPDDNASAADAAVEESAVEEEIVNVEESSASDEGSQNAPETELGNEAASDQEAEPELAAASVASDDKDEPQPVEAAQDEVVADEAPSAPPAAEPAKPKKKSSWEALASMFNIPVSRSEPEPVAAAPEPESAPVVAESAEQDVSLETEPASEAADDSLSFFSEAETQEENPALEEMFGDAPRTSPDEWKRPKRMVDDLGWGDEEETPTTDEPTSESAAELDFSAGESVTEEAATEDDNAQGDDDRPSRGRRRRRGRGRGRGRGRDSDAQKTGWGDKDEGENSSTEEEKELPVSWHDEETSESTVEDLDEPGEEVERRSSRRRRRGRRSASEGERDSRRGPKEMEDASGPEELTSPAADLGDREDEPREDGGRRRRRRRRPAERAEVASRSNDVDADDDDNVAEQKHRNIPTWNDALESLIEANTANHRRPEQRGGRGRSRGRRSQN